MTLKTIANYKILKELGTGGMGTVYLAENLSIGSKVAIKMLHPHLVKSENIKTRFLKEARTQAILDHPNITKVIDFVKNEHGLFIILEYVEGEPLNDFLFKTKGLLPEKEANHYMVKILEAVGYAHDKNVVHRDLKSANIMVTPNKGIKIMDFGIAKLANETMSLTKTGSRLGSPLYMSPEQVTNGTVDFRSDIYSLGVVYHEMLTGTPVYDQNTTTEFEIYNKIVKQPLPRLKEFYKMNSDRAQEIVDTATAKLPIARYQSCAEFKNSLLNGSAISQPSKRKAVTPTMVPHKRLQEPAQVPKKKNKDDNKVLLIILLLLVLIGGGGAGFYYSNNNGKTELSSEAMQIKTAESYAQAGNLKDAYQTYQNMIAEHPNNTVAAQRMKQLQAESRVFQQRSVDSIFQLYLQTSNIKNFQPNDSLLGYKITTGYDHILSQLNTIKNNQKTVGESNILEKSENDLRIANGYFKAQLLYKERKLPEALAVLDSLPEEPFNGNVAQLKNLVSGQGISDNFSNGDNNNPVPFDKVQILPQLLGCKATDKPFQRSCIEKKLNTLLNSKINILNYYGYSPANTTYTYNYSFVMGKDGLLRNIEVSGYSYRLKEKIKEVLKTIKGIKPGFENFVPVEVAYTGYIAFEGKENKNKEEEEKSIVEKDTDPPLNLSPRIVPIVSADQAPIYPGCEGMSGFQLVKCTSNKINHFVSDPSKYKALERSNTSIGRQRVVVNFLIERDGSINNINVQTPLEEIKREVEKVVVSLPRMEPGYDKGESVIIKYSFPFYLNF